MSNRGLIKTPSRLRVKPVPALLVRAQAAGEFVANLGGSDRDADIALRGVMLGAWGQIIVEARDGSGRVCDKATYTVPSSNSGDMLSVADDDTMAMLERLDAGLATLVRKTRDRWQRKGWTVRVFFTSADGLSAERIAQYDAELGTVTAQTGTWNSDYEPIEVARLRPGRDPASLFSAVWGRKR